MLGAGEVGRVDLGREDSHFWVCVAVSLVCEWPELLLG